MDHEGIKSSRRHGKATTFPYFLKTIEENKLPYEVEQPDQGSISQSSDENEKFYCVTIHDRQNPIMPSIVNHELCDTKHHTKDWSTY